MKKFRLMVLVVVIFAFMANVALAQAPQANPNAGEGKKGEGKKMTTEEKKAKMDERQAKRDEAFQKKMQQITELVAKVEKAIAENKINEKEKAKMLDNMKKRLETADLIIGEMKENVKMLESHIKIAEEMKNKANDIMSKLSSYTPPAKPAAATPAAPATPAATPATPAAPAAGTK